MTVRKRGRCVASEHKTYNIVAYKKLNDHLVVHT